MCLVVLCVAPPGSEVVLTHNTSGRFESRFVSVGIQASPSVWLKGMEGSALGVWVAHGEGSAHAVVHTHTRSFIPSRDESAGGRLSRALGSRLGNG